MKYTIVESKPYRPPMEQYLNREESLLLLEWFKNHGRMGQGDVEHRLEIVPGMSEDPDVIFFIGRESYEYVQQAGTYLELYESATVLYLIADESVDVKTTYYLDHRGMNDDVVMQHRPIEFYLPEEVRPSPLVNFEIITVFK